MDIEKIKDLTNKIIDLSYLCEYWGAESLDDFVKKLLIEPIVNWENIDDNTAIELINQILITIPDDSIMLRNSDALEKKYGKPEGTVRDKIVNESITDANELLVQLKKETRFLL